MLNESKNTHLTHLEDSIIINGKDGVDDVLRFIEAMFQLMSINEETIVTRKWDGAPAIIGGINPENGKFFVGTKSVFSKGVPKINYTDKDVDKYHGGQGELPEKLKAALKYLPSIWKKGVFQGDMMFIKSQVKNETINGEKYVTFRPNNITYAVPLNSGLGRFIKGTQFGIVFHTRYTGKTMLDMKGSFNVTKRDFKPSKDVWFDDAHFKDITNIASFSDRETTKLHSQYARLKKEATIIKSALGKLSTLPKFYMSELLRFNNQKIRGGQGIGNPRKYFNEYANWIVEEKRKKSKAFTKEKEKVLRDELKKFSHNFISVLDWHEQVIIIKTSLVKKLDSMKSIKTFLKTGKGFKVVGDEGFVAIQDNDKAFKLVDKMEFTANLFSAGGKEWKA
jgi:hypothetical protein